MVKKVLIGAVVGGVIIFAWGSIAHMALPLGKIGMKSMGTETEDAMRSAIRGSFKESGLYVFPAHDVDTSTPEKLKAWMAKFETGPYGLLIVTLGGWEAMSPRQFGTEFGSDVAAALLASFLLSMTNLSYGRRVLFVTLLGAFGWLSISVPYWNWYKFPTDFTLAALIEEVVGWFLAGLALAAIVRPCNAKPAPIEP